MARFEVGKYYASVGSGTNPVLVAKRFERFCPVTNRTEHFALVKFESGQKERTKFIWVDQHGTEIIFDGEKEYTSNWEEEGWCYE